jgi:hypothetical protein
MNRERRAPIIARRPSIAVRVRTELVGSARFVLRAASAAVLLLLAAAAPALATKPLSPVRLRAKVLWVDAGTRTAIVEVHTARRVREQAVKLEYTVPENVGVAELDKKPDPPPSPVAAEDRERRPATTNAKPPKPPKRAANERVTWFRVTLPRAGGRMVLKASAGRLTGITAVTLPAAEPNAAAKPDRKVITTNSGMKLRIHK